MKHIESLRVSKITQKQSKQFNMIHFFKMLTVLLAGSTLTSLFITHSKNWIFFLPIFIVSMVLFIYNAIKEKKNNDTIRYN
jgi:L-asparagine transporter-like permease